MPIPDKMFYTNEDGEIRLWYPDGDLCAVIKDNLGMGISAEDIAKAICISLPDQKIFTIEEWAALSPVARHRLNTLYQDALQLARLVNILLNAPSADVLPPGADDDLQRLVNRIIPEDEVIRKV